MRPEVQGRPDLPADRISPIDSLRSKVLTVSLALGLAGAGAAAYEIPELLFPLPPLPSHDTVDESTAIPETAFYVVTDSTTTTLHEGQPASLAGQFILPSYLYDDKHGREVTEQVDSWEDVGGKRPEPASESVVNTIISRSNTPQVTSHYASFYEANGPESVDISSYCEELILYDISNGKEIRDIENIKKKFTDCYADVISNPLINKLS